MSTRIMALCWPLPMHHTDKAVLISLADNANDAGYCWPSLTTICERTCLSRRAVIDAIHRLEAGEYIIADRSNGRHTTYTLTVTNQCATRTSAPHAPVRHTHGTSAPHAPDPCATRTLTVINRKEPSKKNSPRVARPPSVPEQVWNDWLAVRKQKKKPLTPTAWAAMERQASKAGIPIERAVEICAAKGWQGFVASYSWQDDEPAKPASQKPRDVWWTSDAAITAKAREVGIPESRWPATYAELKNIVFERLKSMEAA